MIDIDIVGQLIPNPLTLIVQLCSTLVLFLVAKKFLWKSVKNWMEVRADKMQSDLSASEKAKQDAFSDREKASEELKAAALKSQQIVEAAVKEASTEKENILASAAEAADVEKKKAHLQIEAERNAMYDSVRKEMVNVAMDAAGRLIGESNGEALDRSAIESFVKEAAHDE